MIIKGIKRFKPQKDNKITVCQRNRRFIVEISNINYISCSNDLTTIYFCNDRKPVNVSKLLIRFEEELSEYGFVRSIRNHLVNITHVKEILNSKNMQLTMQNGENVPVSVRKLPIIRKLLEDFK